MIQEATCWAGARYGLRITAECVGCLSALISLALG
jgi:hypothetical protein